MDVVNPELGTGTGLGIETCKQPELKVNKPYQIGIENLIDRGRGSRSRLTGPGKSSRLERYLCGRVECSNASTKPFVREVALIRFPNKAEVVTG
jgi:hypothetical protein